MPAPMRCLRPCDLPKLLSLWSSRLARRSPSLLPRCAGHRGLFVAPTLGFRLLYAFIIVRLARRIRLDQRHTSSDGGLDRTPDHGSPWQNGFAERLIGSIRRECLDHVIALSGGAPTREFCKLMPLLQRFENRTDRWTQRRA